MPRDRIKRLLLGPSYVDYAPPEIRFRSIEVSEFPVEIIAGNGTGKSTLCLALAGAITELEYPCELNCMLEMLSGEVHPIKSATSRLRVIPQKWEHGLLGFGASDELAVSTSGEEEWCDYVSQKLQITTLGNRHPANLSDGERKRLMVATALVADLPVLISDEWTMHLDSYWLAEIGELFREFELRREVVHVAFSNCETTTQSGYTYAKRLTLDSEVSGNCVGETPIDEGWNSRVLQQVRKLLRNSIPWEASAVRMKASIPRKDTRRREAVEISGGDVLQVVGPNASGKSTLLRKVWLMSHYWWHRLGDLKAELPMALLIPADPTYQVLGPTLHDEFSKVVGEHQDLIQEFCGTFRLGDPDTDVLTLSFGQRKILASIIAVLSDYPMLLFDEPLCGLDNRNRRLVKELLSVASDFGKIVVVADCYPLIDDPKVEIELKN